MQSERVEICSARLMSRGVSASWFIPLETEASADDVLSSFAQFLMDGSQVPAYPILQQCFTTLLHSTEECMFVFMRRGAGEAVGILRSDKPLCSDREQALLAQIGTDSRSNVPLWTWKQSHPRLTASMEVQCRALQGPCFGVWCYR